MGRAVRERWLKAPVQLADGILVNPGKGTPQGGVISPLLANLFLHYGFDMWMRRKHPSIPLERYADDVVCHCQSEDQAKELWRELKGRFSECGLELHPEKTKIVYCKDDDRRGNYPNESFDFLGYTFRARRSKNRWGEYFVNFSPAVSNQATKGPDYPRLELAPAQRQIPGRLGSHVQPHDTGLD